MNKLTHYLTALAVLLAVASCKVDNYPAPDAQLYGTFLDIDTGEPVEQDIIRGSTIEYTELGYDSEAKQYMIVKNDGTYRNNLIFSNTYLIAPVRGNFVPMSPQEINVQGPTQLDFQVQPYIRVKDAQIEKAGDKVVATFRLDQTVINKVKQIGLYAHPDPAVGAPIRVALTEKNVNSVVDPNEVHRLEIDLPANSNVLKPGRKYFFRVGALINAPEAKHNYAKAVQLSI